MTIIAGAVLGMATVCFDPLNEGVPEHANIEKDIEVPCLVKGADEKFHDGNEKLPLAPE